MPGEGLMYAISPVILVYVEPELNMVVQPTTDNWTSVIEAKTNGDPPLREPYSSV